MKKTILRKNGKLFLLTNYHKGSELNDVLEAAYGLDDCKNIAIVMYGYAGFPLVHIGFVDQTEDYDEAMRILKEEIQSDEFCAPEAEFQDALGRRDVTIRELLIGYLAMEGY